jgi:hypothetical protein
MTGAGYEWNSEVEAERLRALEDPAEIRFQIIGRNGATYGVRYVVKYGQKARIVSELQSNDAMPEAVEQFAMDEAVRVDLGVPEYLLMVYGIECVPEGHDFPDQAGEPDVW